ncbi:MAG: 4-(cytidine 5'-diphospho)-2-C-methyl-D-erythritol kinase [Thermodesulfovibrio sp.]|nr:4-(cytidine 5'-diphospho)-2-C-methyl-D-erythritol kinase [Thermodesulfovibrio sp.]
MLILETPAKINWFLYVLNKREDGYHNVISLMHCIGLYDTLTFEPLDKIELFADMDIPMEQNLVFRAAVAFQKYAGIKKGVKISLKKEIPSEAGLGGGSSDAACTLKGLNALWGLEMPLSELKKIGAELGSDVPFFFDCPMAIAEGRGEILTPVKIDVSYTLLLIKPALSISTSWAYDALAAKRGTKAAENSLTRNMELTKMVDKLDNIKLIYKALGQGNTSFLGSRIYNDFEHIVIKTYSVIGFLKEKLLETGAILSMMSGSGSAVFGLFENRDKAVAASQHFSSYWNRVVETLKT